MEPTTQPLFTRIRQNHALEHATVHTLSDLDPSLKLVGRSDWNGFMLYGQVDTPLVMRAVAEGLTRLKNGESWLAIHPRCGTNLSVAALLGGGIVLMAAALPDKSRALRFTSVVAAIASAMAIVQPLGLMVQKRVTTTGDLEGVSVSTVECERHGQLTVHRVVTAA